MQIMHRRRGSSYGPLKRRTDKIRCMGSNDKAGDFESFDRSFNDIISGKYVVNK